MKVKTQQWQPDVKREKQTEKKSIVESKSKVIMLQRLPDSNFLERLINNNNFICQCSSILLSLFA